MKTWKKTRGALTAAAKADRELFRSADQAMP